MNSDELPIQELKENGLETLFIGKTKKLFLNTDTLQIWIGQ